MHKSNVRKVNPVDAIIQHRTEERARMDAGGCWHPTCIHNATLIIIDAAGNTERLCEYHAADVDMTQHTSRPIPGAREGDTYING